MAKEPPNYFIDQIGSLSEGMNSGVSPLLLDKTQAAFIVNGTVRGGFLTSRPAYKKLFVGSPPVGIFQGAGWYRPDFGPSVIVASIGGVIYLYQQVSGDTWSVTDIAIPGDPNSATQPVTWIWQAEKWLIIQNGLQLPIFFDGVSCRRSLGPSVVLGSVTGASSPTPPTIGNSIDLTLASNYTGSFNQVLLFNGAFYQPNQVTLVPGAFLATLTMIGGTVGQSIPSATPIYIEPSLLGVVTNQVPSGGQQNVSLITLSSNSLPNSGTVIINGNTYEVLGGNFTNQMVVELFRAIQIPNLVGFPVSSSNSQPNILVGNTLASFNTPAIGGTVTVQIDQAYSGPANQTVFALGNQFTIVLATSAPSTTLNVTNLSDSSTAAYVFPQDLLTVPELPAGRMGTYGNSQVWMALPDGTSYMAGDVAGGPSGTAAYNRRDSVLKTTENDFLTGGGSFRIPSTGNIITSMTFMPVLDAALGQGELMIGTDTGFFSCNAKGQRADWVTTTNPLQTQALIGQGSLGQDSTIVVNSDIHYRQYDGYGSLVQARRDFNNQQLTGGNTPISREMTRTLDLDNQQLLSFGSGIVFDNRELRLADPIQGGRGVYHDKIVAFNYDTVSNLREKLPPVYDGEWSGPNQLNAFKILTGNFNGLLRAFAFVFNIQSSDIELWEISKGRETSEGQFSLQVETPELFGTDVKPSHQLCQLNDGEIYVKDISEFVEVLVEYRPDFYSPWIRWVGFTIVPSGDWDYRIPVGLGSPPQPANTTVKRPLNLGYFFQFRITFTSAGSCTFVGARFRVNSESSPFFAPLECNETS